MAKAPPADQDKGSGSASSSGNALVAAPGADSFERIKALIILPDAATAVQVTLKSTGVTDLVIDVPAHLQGIQIALSEGLFDSGEDQAITFDVGAGTGVKVMAWHQKMTG